MENYKRLSIHDVKEKEKLIVSIERRKKLLSNENYVNKAPAHVVENDRISLEKEETKIACEEKRLDTDTILILGLIMLLVLSGCEDTLLLIALGALILL